MHDNYSFDIWYTARYNGVLFTSNDNLVEHFTEQYKFLCNFPDYVWKLPGTCLYDEKITVEELGLTSFSLILIRQSICVHVSLYDAATPEYHIVNHVLSCQDSILAMGQSALVLALTSDTWC